MATRSDSLGGDHAGRDPAIWDVAIVGGGPAGLAAAVATGRLNRRAIVFQAGAPRASHAPCYHNYLGFPEGVSGEELLERGRDHARRWGAEIVDAAVTAATRLHRGPGRFQLDTTRGTHHANGIILATGVKDRQLACGDLYSETGFGVHYCVVCDARETVGARVGVVGNDRNAYAMIAVLRDFSDDLWLLLDGEPLTLQNDERERIARWGVGIVRERLDRYIREAGTVKFTTARGEFAFPHVFIAQGSLPRTEVAESLGCDLDDDGYVVTDSSQATSVPDVYAAGDCDGGHKQVTQAMAEGEAAALELLRVLRHKEDHAEGGAPFQ